jgi:hypothetical protein
MIHNTKGGPTLCIGMRKAERSLSTPRMQHMSIRFAMRTDGVNPFGNQSSTHSIWHVVLSLYNLPPWLCRKKYMMPIILVSEPNQPGDRIDVYMRPPIDDLKIPWCLLTHFMLYIYKSTKHEKRA